MWVLGCSASWLLSWYAGRSALEALLRIAGLTEKCCRFRDNGVSVLLYVVVVVILLNEIPLVLLRGILLPCCGEKGADA